VKGQAVVNKTYRALAIVAVVAPLVSIGSLLLASYIVSHSISGVIPPSPQGGERWIPANELPVWWAPAISSLAAPVIATFAAIVAAESRRWGWLIAFIALGIFGVVGLTSFVNHYPFLTAPYMGVDPQGVNQLQSLIMGYSPMVLLAIVALIFALLPHRETPTQVKSGALAIIVVVAALVSLISIAWSTHNSYAASGSSFNAIGLPILNVGVAGISQATDVFIDIGSLWSPVTNGLAAPIIATVAIIVAAQARRWGWLCALGPAMIPELELGWAVQVNPTTTALFGVGFYQAIPMFALIIVALIFAVVVGRRQRQAAAGALALAGA
jgi:hypothetical protein